MRNAESAGMRERESWWLVRLAMKESWLSSPSCTANQRALSTYRLKHCLSLS